jgi:hypothetical protein
MSNENVLLFLYEKLFPAVSGVPTQVTLSNNGQSQGNYNSNSQLNLINAASAASLLKPEGATATFYNQSGDN